MSKTVAITLPPPPLCMPSATTLVHAGEDVIVNLQNGETLEGTLNDFRMAKGQVTVATDNGATATVIELAEVKTLHIPHHRKWKPNKSPAKTADPAKSKTTEKLDYEIELKDGEKLSGDTLGFRTDRNGLYLFPLQDSEHFSYAFISHSAIASQRIGPRLGEILVDQNIVSEEQVDNALELQEKRRKLPLGTYLREKAIVSAEELEHALEHQKIVPNMKLGEVLISEGLITEEQLENALEAQKKDRRIPLGEILVLQGLVTTVEIQQCLARKLGIPFVDLKTFVVDSAILRLVPPALARKHKLVPLHLYKEKLVVAVENPMNWEPMEAVRFHTKMFAEPIMASLQDLEFAIGRYYSHDEMEDFSIDDVEDVELETEHDDEDEASSITDNVIVKLVNKIIVGAANQSASDIHIEPHAAEDKIVVRIRKDGVLTNFMDIPPVMRKNIVARIKIMAGMDIAERRKPQDGKIDFKRVGKKRIELRVATLPTVGGQEDVVMRILPSGDPIQLNDLGLSPSNLKSLLGLVSRPYGLFFVCGPTGSGKSTTLHSILKEMNTVDRKIWTAEDPVEIKQKGLRQLQVSPKIGLDFASAMRSFLRADPDIIMVGEMRDAETAKTGIEASLTGHMVFSTLHTNTAPESIVRLLDMGMDPFSFADALTGVLAQRLARRLCPDCKRPRKVDEEEITRLLQEYCLELTKDGKQSAGRITEDVLAQWRQQYADKSGVFTLYDPVGCEECGGIGYRGRFAIHELLVASDEIKRCILDHAHMSEIVSAALAEGMRTLKQDGIEKVLQGITDMTQIRKVCVR